MTTLTAFLRDLSFMTFFRDVPRLTWAKLFILALISSSSNTAILALINYTIANLDSAGLRAITFCAFVLAVVCFRLAHKSLIIGTSTLAEKTVHRLRVRFLQRIQSSNLRQIERASQDQIYVCVSSEMDIIADAAFTLTGVIEGALILAVTMTYLAWLSIFGFVCIVIFDFVAAYLHFYHNRQINNEHQRAFELQSQLMQRFTDLIDGFKEVKMSTARSLALLDKATKTSDSVLQRKMILNNIFANNHINSEIAYFVYIMAIVFAIPLITSETGKNIVMTTVSAMFLYGPTFALIRTIPSLQKINAAAKAILSVEAQLGEADRPIKDPPAVNPDFERISLNQVAFQYERDDAFKFGPIDLEIRRGQVLFITGGNGSGKSTLLKLLTGLYFPSQGTLMLDSQLINSDNLSSYRDLFSVIFSDNYLFKILYGAPKLDPQEVDGLFRLMELEEKTRITENEFDSIDLSSGQKKRLAMIAAILEHRPICVFDEWAADQDVHFRQKFYREILPRLRSLGKTVIAVTHDERYFDAADHRLDLKNGVASMISTRMVGELAAVSRAGKQS